MKYVNLILITLSALLASCSRTEAHKEKEDLTYLYDDIDKLKILYRNLSKDNLTSIPEYVLFSKVDSIISSFSDSFTEKDISNLILICPERKYESQGVITNIDASSYLENVKSLKDILQFEILFGYMQLHRYYKYRIGFSKVMAIADNKENYEIGDTIKVPLFIAGIRDLDPYYAIIGNDTIGGNSNKIPTFEKIARKKGQFKKEGVIWIKTDGNLAEMGLPFEFVYEVK